MKQVSSRQQHPLYTVMRIDVPDNKVSWETEYEDYIKNRPYFMHPDVEKNLELSEYDKKRWAEAHYNIKRDSLKSRITFINGFEQTLREANIEFDTNNLPINPMGRTGMYGPGLLGKNGPNQAADPIFTKWSTFTFVPLLNSLYSLHILFTPSCFNTNISLLFWNVFKEFILMFPHLEMISIQRCDTQDWAIPGGMVEAGQTVSQTLKNEINEEACNNMDPNEVSKEIDEIFNENKGSIVYCGYIDDPRNTDSRWLETTAVHFHCSNKLAKAIKLDAGDDAQNVTWLPMTNLDNRYKNLYAGHKMMTDKVVVDIMFIPYTMALIYVAVGLWYYCYC
jgi:ADP-ribose pyrophosphatase